LAVSRLACTATVQTCLFFLSEASSNFTMYATHNPNTFTSELTQITFYSIHFNKSFCSPDRSKSPVQFKLRLNTWKWCGLLDKGRLSLYLQPI